MSKVDTERLKKRTRAPRQPKPPVPIERVKGTQDPVQRWTVHRRNDDGTLGEPEAVTIDGKPHHIFLAFKTGFDAQTAVKLFLSRRGMEYDQIDNYRVKMYAANGWTPPFAVFVSRPSERADIEIEQFNLQREVIAGLEAELAKAKGDT
jgi:hypothetical protein